MANDHNRPGCLRTTTTRPARVVGRILGRSAGNVLVNIKTVRRLCSFEHSLTGSPGMDLTEARDRSRIDGKRPPDPGGTRNPAGPDRLGTRAAHFLKLPR
jgi:hypothetical protein